MFEFVFIHPAKYSYGFTPFIKYLTFIGHLNTQQGKAE